MADYPEFSAMILDMDGLLLDTEITYFQAWRKAAGRQGFSLSESFCTSLTGMHYQAVEQNVQTFCQGQLNVETFRRDSNSYWREHTAQNGIGLRPGFESLFEVVRSLNIPYCLATNSRSRNAHECLVHAGVRNLFPDIVTRDHVHQGKPAPDVFLRAARQLATPVQACLIVEDSVTGIEAAVSAGGYSVFIPSVYPADIRSQEVSDLMLGDLAELAAFVSAAKESG